MTDVERLIIYFDEYYRHHKEGYRLKSNDVDNVVEALYELVKKRGHEDVQAMRRRN